MKQKWTMIVFLSLWLVVSVIFDSFTSGIWVVEVLIYLIVIGIVIQGDPKTAVAGAKVLIKAQLLSMSVKKKILVVEHFTMPEYNREVAITPGKNYFLERKPNPIGGSEDYFFLVDTAQGMPESFWYGNDDIIIEELR